MHVPAERDSKRRPRPLAFLSELRIFAGKRIEEKAQQSSNFSGSKKFGVDRSFKQDSVRECSHSHGRRHTGDGRSVPEGRREPFENSGSARAQTSQTFLQSSLRPWVAHREQFVFEQNQRPLFLYADVRIIITQEFGLFLRRFRYLHQILDVGHAAAEEILEQCHKQIFFAVEICVESAARVSRGIRDFFNARGFESVARENVLRGAQQSLPRCSDANLS